MAKLKFTDYCNRVWDSTKSLKPVTLPVSEAIGLILAEDVFAGIQLPNFNNSAMDGYAVRWEDLKADTTDENGGECCDISNTKTSDIVLRVVADIPAGSSENPRLQQGECARIMTGAPVPDDADTVIQFELTSLGTAVTSDLPETIVVEKVLAKGANIRRAGEDIAKGERIGVRGQQIGARLSAAFVAAGVSQVNVYPRAKVAIISTGDELVNPGERELKRGEIYNSNASLLSGLIAEIGAEVVLQLHADDAGDSFVRALAAADEVADMIITTGGVSVGAFDVVRLELEKSAWQVEFMTVLMQPGKPQGFGVSPTGALVFCLPGNPVSVFASFTAFVQKAIAKQMGRVDDKNLRTFKVAEGWKPVSGRLQLMPVRFVPGGIVPATSGGSGSHLVARLALAEGLAIVPLECELVEEGMELEVLEVLA